MTDTLAHNSMGETIRARYEIYDSCNRSIPAPSASPLLYEIHIHRNGVTRVR